MPRGVRLYFALQRSSVQMSLAYRANVITTIITGAFWQGTGLAMVLIVFDHFHVLAGWGVRDVAFLYGFRLLAHAAWLVPLGSLSSFDSAVRFGTFDQMLVRPVNLFVQATTRPRYFMGIGDVVLALGVFIPSLFYGDIHWTVAKVLLCAVFIVSGALIEASAWVVVSALRSASPAVRR